MTSVDYWTEKSNEDSNAKIEIHDIIMCIMSVLLSVSGT